MYDNVFSGLFGSFKPIIDFIIFLLYFLGFSVIAFVIGFFAYFLITCKVNPFKPNVKILTECKIKNKIFDLFRWIWVDFLTRKDRLGIFPDFGFTFYVGRQGAGKTISMVNYLKKMKLRYPKCIIVANFKCKYADYYMKDWRDILNIRNGTNGVIFAIDEIHSEYSSASSKDVPENLISEISQQRKQRVKIVGTAQFFGRVAKPLREQATTVVACSNLFGRLIKTVSYSADEYSMYIENAISLKKKLKPLSKYSFVLTDDLRSCYDTYEKINRMRRLENKNAGIGSGGGRRR